MLNEETIAFDFTNDIIFSLVMKDEEICRSFLKLILPEKEIGEIKVVRNADTQKTLDFDVLGRGVRLDAYVETDNAWVEIEMQCRKESYIGKRSRYYQSNIDLDALNKGWEYAKLPKSYVIFICKTDHFEKGKAVYRFENYDVENELPFRDETYKIVLNTSCDMEEVPEQLRALYRYIDAAVVDDGDELVKRIDACVREYNTGEWRRRIMTIEQKMKDRYIEGIEEGRAEGREEGKAEAAAKMKSLGMDSDLISKVTGLSVKEIEALPVE